MTGRHAGKVAVVTGAANGIGRASAARLSADGASVVLVDLDGERAAEVAAGLPTPCLGLAADVSDEAGVERYTRVAVDRFGRIDLHHLNAGVFGTFDLLPDVAVADFDAVMGVNVRGQFLGLRAAFRDYRRRGATGSVVLTASIASLTGSADLAPYHVSKHAVVGLARAAAMYGGPLGIRVNAVAPGIVLTDLFAAAGNTPGGKDDMARRAGTTPLRRAGTVEEIAAVTSFLLSDEASYVTGQVLAVDGGATAVNTVRPSGGAGAWDTAAVDSRYYPRGDG